MPDSRRPALPTDENRPLLDLALSVTEEVGRFQMTSLTLGKRRTDVEKKGEKRELVTAVDEESERRIVTAIRREFPNHRILAEEGGETEGSGDVRWIVDPLDGTTNFSHGHPVFCISVAAERNDRIVVGVIHIPYLKETFFAIRGGGAYLNSPTIPIRVSETDSLTRALVATGFAYDRERYDNFGHFLNMARAARGIRRMGAAAIDLCYTACGRYDAFWELGLRPHDVAAGSLIVHEAGGRVSDMAGGDDFLTGASLLVSNGPLHQPILDVLSRESTS